jgi:GNAT superfamily N-acetyltransferase
VSLQVRPARREDLRAVEQVRVATWKVAYRGLVPDEVLDALEVSEERVQQLQDRFGGDVRTWVAAHDGEVVGMAAVGPCRDEDREGEQELYALYVLPEHWGSGAGQALWDAVQPFSSLWVLVDNSRARAFYGRNGFRPDREKTIELGAALREVRYLSWPT